jgi:hypothetical protein
MVFLCVFEKILKIERLEEDLSSPLLARAVEEEPLIDCNGFLAVETTLAVFGIDLIFKHNCESFTFILSFAVLTRPGILTRSSDFTE